MVAGAVKAVVDNRFLIIINSVYDSLRISPVIGAIHGVAIISAEAHRVDLLADLGSDLIEPGVQTISGSIVCFVMDI